MSINTLNITKQWRDRRNVLLLLVTCVTIPGFPCHLESRIPNRLHGFFFFFAKGPTPILAAHHPHPIHPTEYWQQIDFIHDTRHLCTPIRIDEIKAMSRGFTGGKQVKTICKCKILRSSMFILDNRK